MRRFAISLELLDGCVWASLVVADIFAVLVAVVVASC